MPAFSPPPPGSERHLRRAARIVLLAVATAVVAVPVLLVWEPSAADRPAGPALTPGSRPAAGPVGGAGSENGSKRGDEESGGAPAAAIAVSDEPVGSEPVDPPWSDASTGWVPDSDVPTLLSEPVVERVRVQGGGPPTPPAAAGPAGATAGPKDRSPQARQRGLARFGGTPQTEDAVEAGLAWLAAHQSPDGRWSRSGFPAQCPPHDRCTGVARRRTDAALDAGLTGLALLAFLGAGYTDEGGRYADVVRRAVDALLAAQQPSGGFERDESMAGYCDSLATLALAEYAALTRQPRVHAALERAVARLVASQHPLGGWDYLPGPVAGRNDTSITAWVVQALHAAAAAGVAVPEETLVRAALHFVRATERDGRVRYSDAGTGFKLDDGLRPVYRYGPGMLAAGLMSTQMLGWRLDGDMPLRQRGLILAELPSERLARGGDPTHLHCEYYWYYGTLAMFQRGGEDWQRWNARLRDVLLPLQDRTRGPGGGQRHSFGSWPPYGDNWGLWGEMGSRVYTTAIATLTLEVYYRHTPAFLAGEPLFGPDAWRSYARRAGPRERRVVVEALSALRLEIGEPVLVELLDDADGGVALAAGSALATLDNPCGLSLLERVVGTLPPWQRAQVEPAVQRGRAVAALPPVEGRVASSDLGGGMLTLDLPRAYVGLVVGVESGAASEAGPTRWRVVRRFSGSTRVLAERVGGADGAPPPPGARVRELR